MNLERFTLCKQSGWLWEILNAAEKLVKEKKDVPYYMAEYLLEIYVDINGKVAADAWKMHHLEHQVKGEKCKCY